MSKPRRPSALPAGLAARLVAAEAIRRARNERRTLDEAFALTRIEGGTAALADADRGFARALATVVFRRWGSLERALLDRLARPPIPETGGVAEAMRLGAAQLLYLDVPDHAAVDLAVEAVKRDPKGRHFAPLVNAVLRRIAGEAEAIRAESEADPARDAPAWLFERWERHYGPDAAHAIARQHRIPGSVDLTAIGDPGELALSVRGRFLPRGSLRLETGDAVASLPGYAEGAFFVQDAASALPARLLGASKGQRVLDLCAAPGGKTAQLAATGAEVTAVERSPERLARLAANLERLRLSARLVEGDAGSFEDGVFDGVLLDAPCSATGTLRRHPELAWNKRLEDILGLARQQARLLDQAARGVAPGGRLVYATCSLEPEEGERQIAAFLARTAGFVLEPLTPAELGIDAQSVTPEGFLRTLPFHFAAFGGMDGFFAARLRRQAS